MEREIEETKNLGNQTATLPFRLEKATTNEMRP